MHHSKQIHETHSDLLNKVRGGCTVTSELCNCVLYLWETVILKVQQYHRELMLHSCQGPSNRFP